MVDNAAGRAKTAHAVAGGRQSNFRGHGRHGEGFGERRGGETMKKGILEGGCPPNHINDTANKNMGARVYNTIHRVAARGA